MDLLISKQALKLIQRGFQGNGCGSGIVSHVLCFLAQKALRINLTEVWTYHDAEYSIPQQYKSIDHKIKADSYVHHNILVLAGLNGKKPVSGYKAIFAKVIHAVLVMYGSKAYWS
jgi:hypothetical protein